MYVVTGYWAGFHNEDEARDFATFVGTLVAPYAQAQTPVPGKLKVSWDDDADVDFEPTETASARGIERA